MRDRHSAPLVCALAWLAPALLLCTACGLTGPREASRAAVERSFHPYRSRTLGGDDLETFLRTRTAMLISGPATIQVETDDGRLTDHTRFHTGEKSDNSEPAANAARGAAAAVSADGYFLTVAHALAAGPTHVVLEAGGEIRCAPAREVWSDGKRDVALIHAELRPDAWFELAPDRELAAGEVVLAFCHAVGPAAGTLEVSVNLPSLGGYETVAIPHDTPLRGGHSGGPTAMLDGRLLGVQSSTGMDTIFRRRSWFQHVRPDALQRRIEDDRTSRPAATRRAPPR